MPLGDRIRQRRLELGFTQEELARRLGVRQNVISRLEAGGVLNPSIQMIRSLARTLQVTADWLVGMYDDESSDPSLLLATAASP
jgi:transcriptional regulator with XRE-family HTH domain